MNVTSFGDLAQTLLLRSRTTTLKNSIKTMTDELASGQVSNVSARLGGDFGYLADIDNSLIRLQSYTVAGNEAGLFLSSTQSRLELVQENVSELSDSLMSAVPTNLASVQDQLVAQASGRLETVIATLNGSIAGQSIFAGVSTDAIPLESAETLLNALRTELTGQTTAADVRAAAQAWFDDPAGFKATMYTGSDDPLEPIEVGPGERVSMTVRADDQVFRDVMMNFALTALVSDPTLALGHGVRNDIMLEAGIELLGVQDNLSSLRGAIGFTEARVEDAQVRNSAAKTSLESSRTTLLEADPFDTAIRLEDAQFRLESLYSVTVRTSQLSLVNFLR